MAKLNKKNILDKVSQLDIMQRYFPYEVVIGKHYKNPFRADSDPGCYFAITSAGNLVFFDNAQPNKGGNCFDICMLAKQISFAESLRVINNDFNLGLGGRTEEHLRMRNKINLVTARKFKKAKNFFKVKTRSFEKQDLEYWGRFGITKETLKKFNVYPVQKAEIRKEYSSSFIEIYSFSSTASPCYMYTIKDGDQTRVRLYRPFESFSRKWSTNCTKNQIQGYDQLPAKGDTLIISSSLKDAMVFYECGYNSIAPSGESIFISSDKVKELKKRFNKIIVIFDADETGIKSSKYFAKKYNLECRIMPPLPEDLVKAAKDISDCREYMNEDEFNSYFAFMMIN